MKQLCKEEKRKEERRREEEKKRQRSQSDPTSVFRSLSSLTFAMGKT